LKGSATERALIAKGVCVNLPAREGHWVPRLTTQEIPMPLVTLVIVLIVVGVLLWLVNNYIPMDRKIKSILNAVVVIAVVLWLLSVFDLLDGITNYRIG
jgi:uncharacterized membrane protein YidH (DUF202 family)